MSCNEDLRIAFKAKLCTIYNPDDTPAYQELKIPRVAKHHLVNLDAWRSSRAFGGLSRSVLFMGAINQYLAEQKIGPFLRLDQLPRQVSVSAKKFLADVEILVNPNSRSQT